jgi:hypothetical protein
VAQVATAATVLLLVLFLLADNDSGDVGANSC